MKASELREKDSQELKKQLSELQQEQFKLRMQKATNQLTDFTQIKRSRHDIARVKTILNQKRKNAS
jgi:large subunit ribosomal protein L29